MYTLHLPRLWPCFAPRRRWQRFTKLLEDVGASIIKPPSNCTWYRRGSILSNISTIFREVVFSEWTAVVLHPCVVSPILLAFVQHRSEPIYGNNGWRRKDVEYFSTLSFQVLINTCRFLRYVAEVMISCICRSMWIQRSSALAFEARADWNKFWAAADKACWVVLEALRWKSIRHVRETVPIFPSYITNILRFADWWHLITCYRLVLSCFVLCFSICRLPCCKLTLLRSVLPTNGTAIRRQWNTQITQPLVQRPTIRRWIILFRKVQFFFYSVIAKNFINSSYSIHCFPIPIPIAIPSSILFSSPWVFGSIHDCRRNLQTAWGSVLQLPE